MDNTGGEIFPSTNGNIDCKGIYIVREARWGEGAKSLS